MIKHPEQISFEETFDLSTSLKKSENLFPLENREYLFDQISLFPLVLDCQPTVFAREEIDEAIKESKEIKTIIAETSNYQLDLAINDLLLGQFLHADVSTLKRIRDNIKRFKFSNKLNLTLDSNITPSIDKTYELNLFNDCERIDEIEFENFKQHVYESFAKEDLTVQHLDNDKIKKIFELCSKKSEEHNFDKIYKKITKINSLLKSIPGQEANTNINFANVFRLIVWFDEFIKNKDQNTESKLRYYINKLFTINIENIYNIFYELNDSRKSHLIDVFKIGLYNKSLEFDKAWNLIDNENTDLVEKCINEEDPHNLSFRRLADLADRSGMNDEVASLKIQYIEVINLDEKTEILNRLSELAGLGKLQEHFEKALDVIVKMFSEKGLTKEESYRVFLDKYQELEGSLLPAVMSDGKYDFSTCKVFRPGIAFKESIDYLVSYVKRKTLQQISNNSDFNSMEYFWKSNNLIHLILYIMHKNVLMKSLYHETEVKYARVSFIDEFREQDEFVDYGENEKGVHIFGVNLFIDSEKIPCILQIPQIKSVDRAIQKALGKDTPPNQIFDMLRIRISLPLSIEEDKEKIDKCCEILTSYLMNKFGNTTFGKTRYTMTGTGFKKDSLGFKNLKLVLRYQFTHDKRAEFLEKINKSRISCSLEEHKRTIQLELIHKLKTDLNLTDEQMANLSDIEFNHSCHEIKGQVLNEVFDCFDDIVNNEDNFTKVEVQIVPTNTKEDERDDHSEYSSGQMKRIKEKYLPSSKAGLIDAIHFLTFNKFNNICNIPGLDETQTKYVYIQMMEFMINLICEKICFREFQSIFEDPIYKSQIKSILERFLYETHEISNSGINLISEDLRFQSKIMPLIDIFSKTSV